MGAKQVVDPAHVQRIDDEQGRRGRIALGWLIDHAARELDPVYSFASLVVGALIFYALFFARREGALASVPR